MAEINFRLPPAEIEFMRPDYSRPDLVRSLANMSRDFRDSLDKIATILETLGGLETFTEVSDSFVTTGVAGTGLSQGMIAYRGGDLWLPVSPTTAGAYALGACIRVTNKVATIQKLGAMDLLTTTANITRGATVFPSISRNGYVSATRPVIGTSVFHQEIGWTDGPVRNGLVRVNLTLRIEPEII